MPDLRPTAFVIAPGAVGPIRGPVGGPTTILARAETTGGAFTMLENVIPPLQGPPLHIHGREDEMWYVLEGHFRFRADDRLLEAPAGSFVYVPRGTRHAFQNIGDGPARILVMFSPAGMERFFEDIAALPAGPIDPATYRTIAHDRAMEVAGPPLADSDPI